jgi:phosphoglycolate phosphatase-like HAD superfamily hydrolase
MSTTNLIFDFDGVILDTLHEIVIETHNTFVEIDSSVVFWDLYSRVKKILEEYPKLSLGFLNENRPLGRGALQNLSNQELEKRFDEIFMRRYAPSLLNKCISREMKSVINILSDQVDHVFIISNTPHDLFVQFCDKELKGHDNYKALGRTDQMGKFEHLFEYLTPDESFRHEISHTIYVGGAFIDLREAKKDPDCLAFIGVDWGYDALGVEDPPFLPSTSFKEDVLKSGRYVYTPFELVHVVEEILRNKG